VRGKAACECQFWAGYICGYALKMTIYVFYYQ
jgi:hypothetical protein